MQQENVETIFVWGKKRARRRMVKVLKQKCACELPRLWRGAVVETRRMLEYVKVERVEAYNWKETMAEHHMQRKGRPWRKLLKLSESREAQHV